jgi:hypothetical protein
LAKAVLDQTEKNSEFMCLAELFQRRQDCPKAGDAVDIITGIRAANTLKKSGTGNSVLEEIFNDRAIARASLN